MLGNPPGPDLNGLLLEIKNDGPLSVETLRNGYIQFAFWDGWYDPICFDANPGKRWRIVRLDHEQILCYSRIRVVTKLFDNFESFIRSIV